MRGQEFLTRLREEVLLGDKELFREMTQPHVPALLEAARKDMKRERISGNLRPDLLQPEELVGETLIEAWELRHLYSERKPLREWLLKVQRSTLKKVIEEEKKLHEPIVLSLEAPVPSEEITESDENELLRRWIEPPVHECWQDVIPDSENQRLAA